MRLFLHQSVEREEDATPPYLTDRDEDVRFNLLRETTQHVKEGKNRLPTPEKNAIMELSTSFEKRRLGKQQQILSEMTQRCREQEVTDLSSKLTAKCDLKLQGRQGNSQPSRDNPFYSSTTNTFRASNHRISDAHNMIPSPESNGSSLVNTPRTNSEKTYKFFPARRIMRQPTKIHVISTNLPKLNTFSNKKDGRHPNEVFMDSYRSPRHHETSNRNRPRRISHPPPMPANAHVIVHRSDPLAPLVLPRLSVVDPNYQDRIDSYFQSSRMASMPRAKSFLDTASTSGRSYKSMYNLNNIGQQQQMMMSRSNDMMRSSDRSELGMGLMHTVPRVSDEDSMTSGRGLGQSVEL